MTLDSFTFRVQVEKALMIEQRIELVLQPRPRYLPDFLWRKILRRLLVIRETA